MLFLNKKGKFNFQSIQVIEAGISLWGIEVLGLKTGKISLAESRIWIRGREAYILGLHIGLDKNARYNNYDPIRERKLLMHKKQINQIIGKVRKDNLYILPYKIYRNKSGLIKVEIHLGKYAHKRDKREMIKNKEWQREKSKY